MPANFDTMARLISTDTTTGGAITFAYPAGRSRGDYLLGVDHILVWNGIQMKFSRDFTLALNATTVVVTLVAAVTIPANATVVLQLDRSGGGNERSFIDQIRKLDTQISQTKTGAVLAPTVLLSIGSPITIDRDGYRASATFSAPGTTLATAVSLVLNGANVVAGVGRADIPRNVTIYSGSNISGFTFYIEGTDTAGNYMAEAIAGPNATTTQGVKAFATVTSAKVYGSGSPAATEIGFGKVLGLPIYMPNTALVLLERENNAAPGGGAGTFVAGVTTTPSATTGDTRGTYTPSATPDGSIAFHLLVALPHSSFGVPQFGTAISP